MDSLYFLYLGLLSRYKYKFPFLETNGYMSIDDNRVEPLYKHVFPPALAPGLSFVGLPGMVSLDRYSFIGFQVSHFFLIYDFMIRAYNSSCLKSKANG